LLRTLGSIAGLNATLVAIPNFAHLLVVGDLNVGDQARPVKVARGAHRPNRRSYDQLSQGYQATKGGNEIPLA
jgi:hypothetical protein